MPKKKKLVIEKGTIFGFESHAKKPCSKCLNNNMGDHTILDKKYCMANDIHVCTNCERVLLQK